jgi:hypothetical protein
MRRRYGEAFDAYTRKAMGLREIFCFLFLPSISFSFLPTSFFFLFGASSAGKMHFSFLLSY